MGIHGFRKHMMITENVLITQGSLVDVKAGSDCAGQAKRVD